MSICMKELRELVRLEELGLPVRAPLGGLDRLDLADLFGAEVAKSEIVTGAASCHTSAIRYTLAEGMIQGVVNGESIAPCGDALEDGVCLARDWAEAVVHELNELKYEHWVRGEATLKYLGWDLGGPEMSSDVALNSWRRHPAAVGFALWVRKWAPHGDMYRAASELIDGENSFCLVAQAREVLLDEELQDQRLISGASSTNGLSRGIARSSEGWHWSTKGRSWGRWTGEDGGRKARGKTLSEKRRGKTPPKGGGRCRVSWR